MINTKYVVIIDDTEEVWKFSKEKFKKQTEYQLFLTDSSKKSVKDAMQHIPDLIIINEDDLENNTITSLLDFIRKSDAITPIILVSSKEGKDHWLEILKKGVSFYIRKPLNEDYFYYTIKNISNLISSNRCISALTGLPGNLQIENELKRRISSKSMYAVLYMDLDNFKAYNDKYGFMNGDEVIKFTSEVIQKVISEEGARGDFLGHIGGDDFVAIVSYENSKKIGRDIIKTFDTGIKKFYTEEDIQKGWIKVENRKGKFERYPLMTITVAMISNKFKKYKSPLEIGEDGASIKKKAKAIAGSTFLEDRRKSAPAGAVTHEKRRETSK